MNRYFKKHAWHPLYPFESQWMHLPEGLRMHYIDEGEAKPLVIEEPESPESEPKTRPGNTIVAIHGNPTWSFFYRELVKGLHTECRVIVPDHIGCGLSDKPQNYNYCLKQHIDNLELLIERLNPGPFTMVVHDWGGAIGMGYAVRHPEMIKGILFLNTAAYRSKLMPCTIRLARVPVLGELLVRGLNAFVWGAVATSTFRPIGPYIFNGYYEPYNTWNNRIGVLRFVQDIPMDPSHPSYNTLAEIEAGLDRFHNIPKSFVWGAHDHVFTDKFLHRWQEIYPEAKYTRVETAGHWVMEDASEIVIKNIRQLLTLEAEQADGSQA